MTSTESLLQRLFLMVTRCPWGTGTAIALLGMLPMPAPAAAATCTWTGAGGDARWSNAANWTGCPGPVTGDDLIFPPSGPSPSENDIPDLRLASLRLDAPIVITGLGITTDLIASVADPAPNGDGPTIALPIAIPTLGIQSPLSVEVHRAPLTMTGAITGDETSWLVKVGGGTLILGSPTNAWNRLNIEVGTVRTDVAGALPAGARVDLVDPTSVLDLNDADATIRELNGPIAAPLNAGLIFLGSATLSINGLGFFSGEIHGTGGLVKSGDGTLRIGGQWPNTYTGTTTVTGGTLILAKAQSVTAFSGPLVVSDGILRLEQIEQIPDEVTVTIGSPGALAITSTGRETIGSLQGGGTVVLMDGGLIVGANGRSTTFSGTIAGSVYPAIDAAVRKIGGGTLTLTGAHSYSGYTVVEAGTLLVNGSLARTDDILFLVGGTLGGVGTIGGAVYGQSTAGTISPGTSPGILRVNSVRMRGTYVVELNGPIAGSGYDQLDVMDTFVDLDTATLQASAIFSPPAGTQFTIIKSPAGSSHAPVGTFAGLPEGGELVMRYQRFAISYRGGASGNDVVLTALEAPPSLTIDDVTVTEGQTGSTPAVFTVALSKALNEPVSVQYAVVNASAVAPTDYTAQSGTLVFLPGAITQTITATVIGDGDVEPDEAFVVELSGLAGTPVVQGIVTMARVRGTGTIASDDAPRTYYLSEGSTGGFFDEDILIANPNATIAPVTLTFLKEDGAQVVAQRSIAAWSHVTVHADLIPGLESAAASVTVTSEAGVPLMVERTMFWDATYRAGHTGSSVDLPAEDWLFAEGSQGFFSTFLLVANPHATPTDVTFTFLPEGGSPIVVSRTVAPTARLTLYAGEIPALADTSFGVAVHATQPIMAERSMYFGATPDGPWSGGTESAGVTSAATHWFLAEGATGGFFDTYILLSNPQEAAAAVSVLYLLASGETITVPKTVPAHGRLTIDIEGESDPRLKNAAMSTVVTADRPIIAERSMYWAAGPWREAHNSFGIVDLGTRWALAEGRVGGARHFQTYVLLANPQPEAAHVTVTYLREEGAPIVRQYIVPPTSRFNIDVNAVVPEMRDESFGTLIEVTNGVPIAVERSMYWDAGDLFWSGGTNATGMRVP